MKIGIAIEQAAASEAKLARELLDAGERHKAEHDVFHVTRTLARMESGHIDSLAPHAERYGVELDVGEGDPPRAPRTTRAAGGTGAELLGRQMEPGLRLLGDLHELYLLASDVSINWVLLAQGAQAVRDEELRALVGECHDQSLRTVKWATTRIKTAAPQALAS